MEVGLKDYRILRYMLILGLAIVFLAILMAFSGSNAKADVIVDQGGNGDYLTIQEGIDNAIPGENVFVWDGSYNENITIDKSIQLIGNGSTTTRIDDFGTFNNIINVTAEGVEITGFQITESGAWYGIWANVGGFNIHDNEFDTQNWAIYMDITRLNSGSVTIGDINVDNNEVIGTHGFYFNIWFEEPLSGSDLIFGNTVISNNVLHNTQTGIDIDRYTVFSMDQGSVTWGDILVKNNFVNSDSNGIFFWGIFWNMTDVSIDLGALEFSDNNITAQSNGIYIDWWDFCEGIYGNTIATTQDTQIYDNDIVSQSGYGLMLQTDIIGNIIYDSTSITTGDFYIYSNNITSQSSAPGHAGIYFQMSEIAQEVYNDSSVNFGNIYIDSNNLDSSSRGIYFNIVNSFGSEAYDNALVNIGDFSITNNEILSTNEGVYISFNNLGSVMYDQASATLGNFIINNNNLSSGGNGIFIDMDQLGFDMHNGASFAMGYFTMISNNITSVDQGINIQGKNIARIMHNDTIFIMGDFTVNNNVINSTSSMGINFGISSSAYTMTGNASATFGNYLFTNNNITALNSHGLWFGWYDVGYEMYDGAVVSIKDFHLDDNSLWGGPASWVIYSDFINIGNSMHGDSFFSLGDWYAEGNVISSGYLGIYAGPQFWGFDVYDNSVFRYGDFFIRDNVINVTGGYGIDIDYIDTGENMAGNPTVTGGNMSITNNVVASRDHYGFYIYYDFIGYNISDFSYVSTGWIDISYNNFSSINNHGAYIWIYYLGAYMYGQSEVYIGDIMFTNNNVTSDTMNALHFYQFYQNAYQMYNDSYVQIGNVLVNDNYLNARDTGDGIVLSQWQENAYEMSHNASADFGNFEFNHNTITAGDGGIIMSNMGYWGNYLRGDNQVTFGHFFLNDNIINNSNGYGIRFSDWYSVGEQMYGQSTLSMGNIEIMRNNISTIGDDGIYTYLDSWGYNLYNYTEVHFGNFLFNDNIINSTDNGININAFQMCGSYVYNNSIASFGNIEVNGNQIIAGSVPNGFRRGIYFYFYENCYDVFDNTQVYFGHIQLNDNTINCYDSHGIYVDQFYEIGANYMQDNAYFEMGNFEIQRNWIDANEAGVYIPDLAYLGYEISDNSTAVFGDFLFDGNTINASEDGIYINAYDWGYTMTGTSSATFGDFSVSNNIIESGYQGIYCQFEYAGYDMHDITRFEMGSIGILNNTIISGQDPAPPDSYGILFRSRYVGYEMHNESQAIVGPILVNDNTVIVVFGTNADGIYINWISDYGAYMYDTTTFTMNGNIEVCLNTVNTTNGDEGIFCDVYNLGTYLFDDNTAYYGNILFNDNIIIDAYNDGMRILVNAIGYYTYGNSSVTIGNVELNNNDFQIEDGSYYSSIYLDLYDLGTIMYDSSIFNMGHFQMNDNTITNPDGMGLYIEADRLGYQMYNNSNANFGNFEFLRNNISSKDEGITLWYFDNVMANMHNNTSAFFGDFLINDNIINTTGIGSEGIYIEQFQYVGYQMYDASYAELGNFECSGNEIYINSSAYGIYIYPMNWGNLLEGTSTFQLGNWIINDNKIQTGGSGLYFYPESFGRDNGDSATATIGSCEISGNTINCSGLYGIYSGWWYYFAHSLSGNASVEIGGCYIMDNDVWTDNANGIAIDCHVYQTGYEVNYDSQVSLGDYVVTGNTVHSAYSGIWIHYEWVGMFVGVTGPPESHARVDAGDLLINNNAINAPNYRGLDLNYELVAAYTDVNSSVMAGMIQIYNNTIDSYEEAMYVQLAWLGDNMWGDSQGSVGRCEIDDNNLNSQNSTGIYIRVYRCAFTMRENAEFYWEGIYVTNNDIITQGVGIDFWFDDCVDLTGNSIVGFPMLWVTGNTVDSALSAFNFTTVTTPIEVAPTAELNWGDVIIENNIFDGGLYGMALNWLYPNASIGQPAFFINNCDIFGGAAGSTGLFLFNITDIWAERITIDTFDYGIYSNNSVVHHMLNGSIANCAVLDISFYSASYLFMINSTFDNSSVFFEDFDSLLEVAWFMNVLVQSQVAFPVPEAIVAVADVDRTEIFNGTANADGQAFYIICMEYQENITGIIKNFNDYTANATKGVDFGVAVPNPTMNQTQLVIITLIDLTPPTIFGDNSDTAGTTGDPFYFEINASDNMGIVSVHVNYRPEGVGMYKNLTMNGTGPYWLYEDMPSDYVGLIEYYFTAVDSGGFWVNTTPTTAPITDNDAPTYIWISQPLTGTTGESVLVSIQATDNIGITYYKIDVGGVLYDLVKDGDYYNFTLDIPPDSIADIIYSIILNDSANNPITIPGTPITVTDNDEPTYTWVLNPTTGLAGGSFKVSLMATDNIGITNYTITINGTTYDLVKEGDYYNYTYNIPAGSTEDITYNVTFMDNVGNSNTTAGTVLAITDVDTEAPIYNWILQPTSGTTGESVLVSLLATDNLEIVYYKIEIDGVSYDLIKDGDYYNYTINIPSDSLASITYSVAFNDAADNPATTPDTTITVTDNDAPAYSWVLHPEAGTAGGAVLISLTASDNIGITYYKIDIDGTLYDLIKDENYFNYTINLPPGSSDSITYDITFKDAADNEISIGDTVITVTIPTDTKPPEFTWVLHPEAGTTGESLLVSVIATDNIGITYYKISVDGTLYDLVKEGNFYNYTINIPTDSLASITYFVVFNDSANNPNTATDTVITVTDNDPATISYPASDTSGKKGKEFRFQIDVSDNIGISEVKVWYWFGDDDSQMKSLVLTEENRTYSGSITPEASGNLHYYFKVTDSAGNTFQSDEYSVAIGTAEKEDEEEMNIFPFIILVIIIIIVILLFLLTRKKKEAEEIPEVEEGLAEGEEEDLDEEGPEGIEEELIVEEVLDEDLRPEEEIISEEPYEKRPPELDEEPEHESEEIEDTEDKGL